MIPLAATGAGRHSHFPGTRPNAHLIPQGPSISGAERHAQFSSSKMYPEAQRIPQGTVRGSRPGFGKHSHESPRILPDSQAMSQGKCEVSRLASASGSGMHLQSRPRATISPSGQKMGQMRFARVLGRWGLGAAKTKVLRLAATRMEKGKDTIAIVMV